MSASPFPTDIALRLGLTLVASALFGIDRELKGHPAGLRTMVLAGLAAALAMIEANLLLGTEGKTQQSFGTMDVMRLPLGILTGVGFIGGGAILRRGGLITGITTAATLWFVTMLGLCFGAGQIGLGLGGTALGLLTVWGLKGMDHRVPRERRGELVIEVEADDTPHNLEQAIADAGLHASLLRQSLDPDNRTRSLHFALRWTASEASGAPLDALARIESRYRVRRFSVPSTLED